MAGSSKLLAPLYDNFWLDPAEEFDGIKSPGPLPAKQDKWAEVMLDFEKFCYHHIIINKNGHAVRMVLNAAQKKVANLILPYAFAHVPEPVQMIILKSRQMGISTVFIAIEKYVASRKRNINLLHIFPTERAAKDFYVEKVEPLWEGSHPDIMPDAFSTTTPTPYIKIRDFVGKNMNTNLRIVGGNSKSLGRSTTNHIVISDEHGFQENAHRIERGVLPTIPKTGLAIMAYVSTANGMNFFYDIWQQGSKPESKIKTLFLPWHMMDEYEMDPYPESRFYDLAKWQPTARDVELIEIFKEAGYPKETWVRKLTWYDKILIDDAKGDEDQMKSEYPSTPDEPFSATGRPVFPLKVINYYLKQDLPFTPIGMNDENGKIDFVEVNMSGLRMYQKPISGHRYSIGVDTATAVNGGDLSAGMVVDETTMEEVCSFVLDIEQSELAELVVNLAKWYNRATIVPERNMGELFINSLTDVMGYYRIYIDEKATTHKKVVYGVRTTQTSKREAIRRLKFLLNNNIYKPRDRMFIEQMLHYSYKVLPSGDWKAEAIGVDENGDPNRDDAVAARLAWVLGLDMRRWKKYINKETKGVRIYA